MRSRPMSLPLSVRLALWYALALLILLSAFAVFCYLGYHAAVHHSFDQHLAHELGVVAPLVASSPDGPSPGALSSSDAVATRLRGANATYVRLLGPDGSVRYQSPNFDGQPPLPVVLPTDARPLAHSQTWAGEPSRTLVTPWPDNTPPGQPLQGFVEVTGYEWARHREVRELGRMLAVGVLVGVLFALVAGWWLARRALRPVAVLTDAAARMAGPGSPWGTRLPADFDTRDELTDLAETFNGLLDRLDASAARERRFTANAAHELLTPLTTLRSEAEVALRRERDPQAYRDTLGRVVEDAAAMAATVRALLTLARAEALGRHPDARTDLSALVHDRAERLRPAAEAKGVTLSVTADPDIRVAAEAPPLAEVADNLVGNAVKYTPPGGHVRVRLSHGPDGQPGPCGGAARIEVIDSGPGFDAATCDRLFDRFFRADTPEVQAQPGSGLGLAIVRAVVEGYGGSVGCSSPGPGQGARFWADLPCLGPDD